MVITLFGTLTQPAGPAVPKGELFGVPFDEGEGRAEFASNLDAVRQEIDPKSILWRCSRLSERAEQTAVSASDVEDAASPQWTVESLRQRVRKLVVAFAK
jgi:hypothetical protein